MIEGTKATNFSLQDIADGLHLWKLWKMLGWQDIKQVKLPDSMFVSCKVWAAFIILAHNSAVCAVVAVVNGRERRG